MKCCQAIIPNAPFESKSTEGKCLRKSGHADGMHLAYDYERRRFFFWEIDLDCDCPAEEECNECVTDETTTHGYARQFLERDFRNELPQEVIAVLQTAGP